MNVEIVPPNAFAELPCPARYTPFDSGVYKIATGVRPMHQDCGNGVQDSRVFQFDNEFARYRDNKFAARKWGLHRYVSATNCPAEVMTRVVRFVIEQLAGEHSTLFQVHSSGSGIAISCALTGETLHFDADYALTCETYGYESALDALACQVQEDLAIVCVDSNGVDRVAAVHVTAPSFWNPPSKIGLDFACVHEPVPGMEKLRSQGAKIAAMLVKDVRYQRFGWSVTTDDRLDHHEVPPPAFPGTPEQWRGDTFDPDHPRAFVRIERQVLAGFPEVSAYLFLIRPYLLNCEGLTVAERHALANAIESMSPESLRYKNLARHATAIAAWLRAD